MSPSEVIAALICLGAGATGSVPCSAAAAGPSAISLSADTRAKCLAVLREAVRAEGEEDFWPAIHAAEGLTLAGEGEEVRRLIEPKLEAETDDQRRCGLARELVRAGDRSKAAILLGILAGRDPHGYGHAAESLYKVNEIGDGRALRAALGRSEKPSLALMAAAALGRWGDLKSLALLRRELGNADAEVARIAAWVLGRIGGDSDIPAVRARLETVGDPVARAFFQHALAALGDSEGLVYLGENLNNADPAIRTYAAEFAGDARALAVKDRLVDLLEDGNIDVRARAAQSLIVLSQPPSPDAGENFARDVYEATEANPRYSEGSVLELRDGSLLCATTEFIGQGADHSRARIMARRSEDGGRNWGPARVLQENTGDQNVMSATLRRLGGAGGAVALFYLEKNSASDLRVLMRLSGDEGASFGDAVAASGAPGYHVMNNDRVTQLSGGRLLAPVAWTADVGSENHFVSFCLLSDDGGRSWRRGKGSVDYAKRGAMEPEVIELEDGRVLMIARTQLGHIAASYSQDGGETWGEARPWGVRSPEAPATLRRIPSTGDLVLVWNDAGTAGADHGGKRVPLSAAISSDEGATWEGKRNLEEDPAFTYSYTSLAFAQGRAVMSYYVRDDATGRISSRFRSVPIGWFYSER